MVNEAVVQTANIYDEERNFMDICYSAGWRYSGRGNGMPPRIAGTFTFVEALVEAKDWANHNRPAVPQPAYGSAYLGVEEIDATHFGMMNQEKRIESALRDLLGDMEILAGDVMGPSDASWQDVAGTAAVNAEVLAHLLNEARRGNAEAFFTFPSPSECLKAK